MSLGSVLKTVGADLNKLATWIETGLKIAGPIATAVDPPLGPIITAIELVIADVQAATTQPVTAATVQEISQAVTTLMSLKLSPSTLSQLFVAASAPAKTS